MTCIATDSYKFSGTRAQQQPSVEEEREQVLANLQECQRKDVELEERMLKLQGYCEELS